MLYKAIETSLTRVSRLTTGSLTIISKSKKAETGGGSGIGPIASSGCVDVLNSEEEPLCDGLFRYVDSSQLENLFYLYLVIVSSITKKTKTLQVQPILIVSVKRDSPIEAHLAAIK